MVAAKPKPKTKTSAKPKATKFAIQPATNDYLAEGVRTALLKVAEQNDGALPPHSVVDAARSPDSELHQYFEWDDTSASEAYRIIQARGLIRRVRLTIIRNDNNGRAVDVAITREFQSRPSMRRPQLGYERVDDIMADTDKRAEMLAQARNELRAIQRRYKELNELAPVWEAISKV